MKKFSSVDEVLDFAIKREIEAQNFYMKLADFVEKPEMAKVLSDLASVPSLITTSSPSLALSIASWM